MRIPFPLNRGGDISRPSLHFMTNRDFQSYQESYLRQPYEKYQVAFRKRKILELIQKYDHQRLLEVGAGLESIFLRLHSYQQLTVVEPATMFYEKALQDVPSAVNQNIRIKHCLLEELPPETFDFIIVSSLLHEIKEPDHFLDALQKLCSAATVVHINVPNARSFHRLLAVKMGLIASEFQPSAANIDYKQPWVFDVEQLQKTVSDHGFTVLESGSYSFKPFPHQLMQNMLDAKLLTEAMIEGFYQMEAYLPDLGSEIFVNIQKRQSS